jgi:hypothetical protein
MEPLTLVPANHGEYYHPKVNLPMLFIRKLYSDSTLSKFWTLVSCALWRAGRTSSYFLAAFWHTFGLSLPPSFVRPVA